MIKSKHSQKRCLPLAALPLLSMAVLVGCSSNDDKPTTTPDPDASVVGDANGNGIADGFESINATDDANGNGISDVFEAPAELTAAAADTNANSIDDSFEASLTGGADANADGIDDEAAAAVAVGESCASGDNEQCALLAQIEDQRALWDSSSLDNYVYRYIAQPVGDTNPGCPVVDVLPPNFITVQNGSIVSASYGGEDGDFSDTRLRTIDQHFDFMRDNVDRLLSTVTYSQTLGYPTRFSTADPIEGCPSWTTGYDIKVCDFDIDCEP